MSSSAAAAAAAAADVESLGGTGATLRVLPPAESVAEYSKNNNSNVYNTLVNMHAVLSQIHSSSCGARLQLQEMPPWQLPVEDARLLLQGSSTVREITYGDPVATAAFVEQLLATAASVEEMASNVDADELQQFHAPPLAVLAAANVLPQQKQKQKKQKKQKNTNNNNKNKKKRKRNNNNNKKKKKKKKKKPRSGKKLSDVVLTLSNKQNRIRVTGTTRITRATLLNHRNHIRLLQNTFIASRRYIRFFFLLLFFLLLLSLLTVVDVAVVAVDGDVV